MELKKSFIVMITVFISLISAGQTTITKIFIVRHADRHPVADDLISKGLKRANELKRILGKAKIDSIFSTDFTRTKKTAKPLSILIGRPIIPYSTEAEVINRIKSNSVGKRILVVGHSNTVAKLIQLCNCTPPPAITPNIPDTQFDNLFLVILHKPVSPGVQPFCELIPMKYGAITN